MHNEIKDSVLSKNWLQAIIGFTVLQLVFIILEWIDWIPNVKDFEGNFLDNVSQFLRINEWATFYETPFFNIMTVYIGIILVLGIIYQIVSSLFQKAKNRYC